MVLQQRASVFLLLLSVNILSELVTSAPVLIVTTPNVVRLGVEESILITGYELDKDLTVAISLQDWPDRKKTFGQTNVVVSKDMLIQKASLTVERENIPEPSKDSEDKAQYVYIIAECTAIQLKQESLVIVDPANGHVFIQLDKPIYNPSQSVRIRLIPVDINLLPSTQLIRLEIFTPDNVNIGRYDTKWKGKFIQEEFKFPANPVFGNWTAQVSYGHQLSQKSSVQFQVKDYVLPRFSVKVTTDPFILPRDKTAHARVEVKYVYGEAVRGRVYFTAGVILDGVLHKVSTKNDMLSSTGEASITIPMNLVRAKIPEKWFPDGGRIYIKAEATENATNSVETVEDVTCLFVRSPYVFDFTESRRYFKPQLRYDLKIRGVFADERPASKLPISVKATGFKGKRKFPLQTSTTDKERGVKQLHLNDDGRSSFKIDIVRDISKIEVTVWSRDSEIAEEEQARGKFEITPYKSESRSYIHLFVENDNIKVGDRVTATALLKNNANVNSITFVVLSRGRIAHYEHQLKKVGTTATNEFMVTAEMVPSIRIIAFFVRKGDVISDSIHLGIQSGCKHELTLSTKKTRYKLRDKGAMLNINGEAGSLVGLMAVDKSVYLLSEKDVLTRDHLFHTMDKFDLGCGNGGGKDTNMVFEDAGLMVMSNTNVQVPKRKSLECPRPHDKKKRALTTPTTKRRFTNHTLACCKDGVSLSTEKICGPEAFALKNVTKRCRNAFFKCCIMSRRVSSLQRSDHDVIKYDLDFAVEEEIEEFLMRRSTFPESWLWETKHIGANGILKTRLEFPSTITEWVIHGVSMSPTTGMCISPLHNVTVFTEFFIELRLPPIAVREEQIEIKAIVFNYNTFRVPFSVYLMGVKGICSEARPGRRSSRRVWWVEKQSTRTISYPIMPLRVGVYDIQVIIFTRQGDQVVTRKLRVKAEGKPVVKTLSLPLDPQGILDKRGENKDDPIIEDRIGVKVEKRPVDGKQLTTVQLSVPEEALKGTESCRVTAIGDIMGPVVEFPINGVQTLIKLPTGCGEQTMIKLAPLVFAYKYLKSTKRVNSAIEKLGNDYMRQGIIHQLKFRKGDGSFTVWPDRPSSTWLTAFCMKTFCQASSVTENVDDKLKCEAAEWIVNNRQPIDKFTEQYHVLHREMIGGVNGDVSMTAYILVALLECNCKTHVVQTGIAKASKYLELHLHKIDNPLSLAMTTYALAMKDSHRKQEAYEKLLTLSKYDEVMSIRYWPVAHGNGFPDLIKSYWYKKKPSAIEVEITTYAILAELALGDVKSPVASIKWLVQQRSSKGSFVSTQDTVVALQALSEYAIKTYTEDLDMWNTLTSSADTTFEKKIHLQQNDALVQKAVDKLPTCQGQLTIETKGKGVGAMEVELSFNVWNDTIEVCQFEIDVRSREVEFVGAPNNNRKEDEVCEFDSEKGQADAPDVDDPDEDDDALYKDDRYWNDAYDVARSLDVPNDNFLVDGMTVNNGERSRVGSLRKRDTRRQKRLADGEGNNGASKSILCIEVCTNSLKPGPTGMSVMDIGLFTGFKAKKEDLERLKTKHDLINEYEEKEDSVILYLSEVPVNKTCFRFRAVQEFDVGNIQPAVVRVYDYYEPNQACMQFYRPDSKSPLLLYHCPTRRSCRCMQGKCPPTLSAYAKSKLTERKLQYRACFETDYALKVRITEQYDDDQGRYTVIQGEIEEVIKPGLGDTIQGDLIKFELLKSCKAVQLSDGKSYLIMGKDHTFTDAQNKNHQKYYLDDEAFLMEYYNTHDKRLSPIDSKTGELLDSFTFQFTGVDRTVCKE